MVLVVLQILAEFQSRERNIENHTTLCKIITLKWIIQICSSLYCWDSDIAFHLPNPHCCLGKPSL